MSERKFKSPGNGSTRTAAKGVRRIVISFDEETFQEVRDRAAKRGQSFAASARELVEWGLMEEEGADL